MRGVRQTPLSRLGTIAITTLCFTIMLRHSYSTCAFAEGFSRMSWPLALPSLRAIRRKSTLVLPPRAAHATRTTGRQGGLYACAASTKATILVESKGEVASNVEEFEGDLDAMALVCDDEEDPEDDPGAPSPSLPKETR